MKHYLKWAIGCGLLYVVWTYGVFLWAFNKAGMAFAGSWSKYMMSNTTLGFTRFFIGAAIGLIIAFIINLIKKSKKQAADKEQAELQSRIDAAKEGLISSETASNLLNFKTLLDEGIITEEEFEKKKQELLNR